MIGFIVALKKEAENFIQALTEKKEVKIIDKLAYEGYFCGKKVVLIICGIGKVNASLSTQALIDIYNPDIIINFGSAGGMNSTTKIKEYYLVDKCCQYDFDVSVLDNVPVGYIQDYDTVFFDCYHDLPIFEKRTLATGDRFNNDVNDLSLIADIGCSLRDMEGASIAQVCKANNKKLIMLKGISDVTGDKTANEQFVLNLASVSNGFPNEIKRIIELL